MKIDRLNPCYAAFHADAVERLSRLPEDLFRMHWHNQHHERIAYEVLSRVMNVDEVAEFIGQPVQPSSLSSVLGLDELNVETARWARSWADRNRVVVQITTQGPIWPQIIALAHLQTGGFFRELTLEERRQVVAHEACEILNRAIWTRYEAIVQTEIARNARFWEHSQHKDLTPQTIQSYVNGVHAGRLLILRRPERQFGRTTGAGVRAVWRNQRDNRIMDLLPEFEVTPTPTVPRRCVSAYLSGYEAKVWREFLRQDVVNVADWMWYARKTAQDILSDITVDQFMVTRSDLRESTEGKKND